MLIIHVLSYRTDNYR